MQAVWLGVIEGLTEFLPVSSTGHLILFERVLQSSIKNSETFEIFIQLGAILAVALLYWKRFRLLVDFSSPNLLAGFSGWAGLFKLAAACAPAFILGAGLHESIKATLFKPFPVGVALITGAVLMFIVESNGKPKPIESVEQLSLWHCFGIGVFQCLALWPGMSRSGSTIIGAMLLGVARPAAADFSC